MYILRTQYYLILIGDFRQSCNTQSTFQWVKIALTVGLYGVSVTTLYSSIKLLRSEMANTKETTKEITGPRKDASMLVGRAQVYDRVVDRWVHVRCKEGFED